MTIEDITQARDTAKEAYYASLSGRSYTINLGGTSRQVTRNDSKMLREEWERWELRLAQAQSGRRGIPIRFITPN